MTVSPHLGFKLAAALSLSALALPATAQSPSPAKPVLTRVAASNSYAVEISAKPEHVWRVLLDRSYWQPNFYSRKTIRGAPNTVGEIALYTSASNGRTYSRQEETLRFEPLHRLELSLGDADTGVANAFVSQRLTPHRGGTRVEFTVFWWDDYDRRLSSGEIEKLRREESAGNLGQIEAGLKRLKEAVERERRRH